MKQIIPTIVIGSKQANAFVGSVNGYCSCITSACGMGGGQTPMIVYTYEAGNDMLEQQGEW